MVEWIIIGGGIQGCTVASFLLRNRITNYTNLKIVDPYPKPLSNWERMTNLTGMTFLRSPSVHHLDLEPFALQQYAKKEHYTHSFYGKYKRPSLELFKAHYENIFQKVHLEKCWFQGKVNKVERNEHGWVVGTEDGNVFNSKRIVIAIGVTEQPYWPIWAKEICESSLASITHIFDKKLKRVRSLLPPIVIVGGGMTAGQLAIKLSQQYPSQVTLIARHSFRIHDFDSDPGWLGPKNLRDFHNIKCYERRRLKIVEARNKGSVTKEVFTTLQSLVRSNSLTIIHDEIESSLGATKCGQTVLKLKQTEDFVHAKSILLATGFESTIPKDKWLSELITKEGLPCAPCGYPIVSKSLEWAPNLYTAGALAELEIGPVSRNIAGARKAAERITRLNTL